MEIVVYISLPGGEMDYNQQSAHYDRRRTIIKRLRQMVDGVTVTFSSFGRTRTSALGFTLDALAQGISEIAKVNFVIFGDGWERDKQCRIEHATAVLYGITHCGEDEIETFFRDYITGVFKLDKNPAKADTDV